MVLYGIDVSAHQTTTPPLAGVDFVGVRACYGSLRDTMWATHSAAVRAAGLPLVAYCFGRSSHYVPVADQVAALLAVPADGYALDVEADGSLVGMTEPEAALFVQLVHGRNKRIGLYHSASGYPDVGQDWRWVASWTTAAPAIPWDIWQYRGSPLDLDRFDGTRAQLLARIGGDMGYSVSFSADEHGLVTVPGPGHGLIFADGHIEPVAAGTKAGVIGLRTLSPDVPGGAAGADRHTVVEVALPDGRVAFLLVGDTDWPAGRTPNVADLTTALAAANGVIASQQQQIATAAATASAVKSAAAALAAAAAKL